MKKFFKEFLLRGLICAAGGPIILAIIYGILSAVGEVAAITTAEACKGILSITVMAFIAAGITAIYKCENLPLISSIFIHGGVLYLDYLIVYFMNNWLPKNTQGFLIFSICFVLGYIFIWLCVYLITKYKTDKLNKKFN